VLPTGKRVVVVGGVVAAPVVVVVVVIVDTPLHSCGGSSGTRSKMWTSFTVTETNTDTEGVSE
jgi:hypothetical protein